LKYFFSEGIATEGGEDVSNKEVKSVLNKMVSEKIRESLFQMIS
jgi:RNA polymerase sigma-54 factor